MSSAEAPQPSQPSSPEPSLPSPADERTPAQKVRGFPQKPGVYLMKDDAGRVIYVGKAKNLRARAGSYFLKAAAEDPRTAPLVPEIRDIDCIEVESEIDAVLLEARLIKDIQPRFNRDLRDGKSFPYLEIETREDFPRVRFTREPKGRGVKLYGPFVNPRQLRGMIQVLQKVFKYRTCELEIDADNPRWRWFRPCLLHSIGQCSAPCNLRISKEDYRKSIQRLQRFLEGQRKSLLADMQAEMAAAAKELRFEDAAELRDALEHLQGVDQRGRLETHVQPEVFPIDPKRGLVGLQKVLALPVRPRTIEGVDIAHTQGADTVASLVQFIDGLPFKPGYKRYRIRSVVGVDDFASIREVVARRLSHTGDDGAPLPDILLIDGGKGQLAAALAACEAVGRAPPTLLSLAKREELIFAVGRDEPLRLSRHSFALRLLQYVRDEAHRFAQHYHHILRRRSTLGE